ncbi:hypothetical protein PYW07_009612 [Mythimna separata]|uniref:DDE Tnp4 domain-containing protein n=1 Tax=Mythimna separata TaxID=271217 RepID=A0AAD7YC64_MYTSE|nr:hypothetical protein PYW07_009612 [Mythimna separata]
MLDSRLRRLTKRNNAITPVDQILLALQFYASGSFLRCVGDSKGVHKSTQTLQQQENISIMKVIRTRNVVERTFGCWKRRFPAIGSKLRVNLKYMQAIIVATAVLHNICRKMNEEQPPDLVDINEEIDIVHETGTNYEDSTRGELISSYFDRLADNHII